VTEATEIEVRARQIAAKARSLLADDEADWTGYCLPGCPLCAIELAREQFGEERGWSDLDAAPSANDDPMKRARRF
jgi:hypothetical protein